MTEIILEETGLNMSCFDCRVIKVLNPSCSSCTSRCIIQFGIPQAWPRSAQKILVFHITRVPVPVSDNLNPSATTLQASSLQPEMQ